MNKKLKVLIVSIFVFTIYGCTSSAELERQKNINYKTYLAEQGDLNAQMFLISEYLYGQGDSPNYNEGFKWAKKAAEQGNALAMGSLAQMYSNGQGVSQNYNEGFKWAKKSAEQGNAVSMGLVAEMYGEGQGVSQNDYEAFKWMKKSAEHGNAMAMLFLGGMYQIGMGVHVPPNYKKAYIWCYLARSNGSKQAKKYLEDITSKMTQKSINEALNMAQICFESKYKNCG